MKEFLTKKVGGLPVWAWALIGVAGVGAGYLLIRYQQKKSNTTSALTAQNSADLTTGNASGNETNPSTGQVGSNGIIDNPFPETNVNGQNVPIIPPGYQAVYDSNGNIVGWEPITVNPTPAPPPPTGGPPPPPTINRPTGIFHSIPRTLPPGPPPYSPSGYPTDQPVPTVARRGP